MADLLFHGVNPHDLLVSDVAAYVDNKQEVLRMNTPGAGDG